MSPLSWPEFFFPSSAREKLLTGLWKDLTFCSEWTFEQPFAASLWCFLILYLYNPPGHPWKLLSEKEAVSNTQHSAVVFSEANHTPMRRAMVPQEIVRRLLGNVTNFSMTSGPGLGAVGEFGKHKRRLKHLVESYKQESNFFSFLLQIFIGIQLTCQTQAKQFQNKRKLFRGNTLLSQSCCLKK